MVKLTQKEIKAYRNGDVSINDLSNQLLEKYPATEIAKALIEVLTSPDDDELPLPQLPSITVTADEMKAISGLFRIKGSDGRGRKPKKPVTE